MSNYRPFFPIIGGPHYIEPNDPFQRWGYRLKDDGTSQLYCVQCRLAGSGENFIDEASDLVQHIRKCEKEPKSVRHRPVPDGFLCTPDEFPVAIELNGEIRLIHAFKSTKGIDKIELDDDITLDALEDFVRSGLRDYECVTGWICRHCTQNGDPLQWGCLDGLSDHWLNCKYNSRNVQAKEVGQNCEKRLMRRTANVCRHRDNPERQIRSRTQYRRKLSLLRKLNRKKFYLCS